MKNLVTKLTVKATKNVAKANVIELGKATSLTLGGGALNYERNTTNRWTRY